MASRSWMRFALAAAPTSAVFDKGYDHNSIYDGCEQHGCRPIIPLRKLGKTDTPTCEHGPWTFAGADFKRKLTKWRCPSGECEPKSRWVRRTARTR